MSVQSPSIQAEEVQANAKPKAVSNADKHIWGIFIALCIISTIELYSASSREVASSSLGVMGPIIRHLVMLAGGALLVYFLSRRHYSDFIPFTLGFALVSVVMMVYVMFFGEIVNGARRSLTILGIGIYPAEMVKLSAVLLIALVMTWNPNPKNVGVTSKAVVYSGVIVLFLSGLLIEQGLTNTLLLLAISYSMMIVGGVRIWHLFLLTGAYAACGGVFLLYLVFSEPKQTPADEEDEIVMVDGTTKKNPTRLDTWIARLQRHGQDSVPKWEVPATGKNRQEILSYMAQANGGIYGVGPGNSREASRLPLAFSDYIFAIIIEELGLIGGIVVMILYLWLLGRASGIASHCNRTYPALVVIGMAVMIAFQALFHMGIVSGVFPVSGQPLPLLSKGGTSIVVTAIAFGIMLSISRTATRQGSKKQDIRDEIDTLPEQFGAENQMQL
ncbi:MAG: FtsW/RodA/SpoVE family cell cycle protein [Bacteroides sp.]|nr:FtsW/RodA/SpoVE family cell cycle protein [Bacteroides sp.]MBD5300064.1 FtsW/RodA/SpoVE family cell cycle protein [Bacteroides sp.]MBD5353657.1 FtsW/RodA/SpoVE family cell cycle protein [Bacteroides sp.]MDE5827832.1 FtsW/RodA/SpoVE family cell cycle protein [Duncaniella sp.]MDE6824235.1 FtsW/RodA/SpoVE family cell cycle protein [Duncaniella sp.]